MSIWGKIIGGTAGFALGGPLGAIIGMLIGGSFDRSARKVFEQGVKFPHNKNKMFLL